MTLFERAPCDDCSSFDFSCTGRCRKFGVRLRVIAIKIPAWVKTNGGMIWRSALEPDHPESRANWIRANLGIEPEEWMIKNDNQHSRCRDGRSACSEHAAPP